MPRPARRAAAAAAALWLLTAVSAAASQRSAELRARAADELYNLDPDRAAATYREAIAADPRDAAAYRGLAAALWMEVAFQRGTLTVDSYLGRVTGRDVHVQPPPPEAARAFRDAVDRAIALSRERVAASPRDPGAHYELGAAIGLRASYLATVEGSVTGAFRAAREAFNAHEKVLELDPARLDAGLIVGTYRYLVAALSLPLRWVAYAAGFGGGRERGLQMVEAAARHAGDNQTDARIALVMLYNREKRYDEALAQLAVLRERYPRNRLLWLETASTLLRARHAGEAERWLSEGVARLAADSRPRMFGEESLWRYKRGLAYARLKQTAEARRELTASIDLPGRGWVHARAQLEMGRLLGTAGDRAGAARAWQTAITLADSDSDPQTAAEARRLLSER